MRSRATLLIVLFAVSFLALPLLAHANSIPFFGPVIDVKELGSNVCPLGWGAVIIVINNIILLLLTIAIVFVAPLMIAWAGFLFVVNPVRPEGKEQAKKILLNTVVGIVIALAGWMIVGAIMAVLYNGTFGAWSSIITSSGEPCLPQKGTEPGAAPTPGPGVTVVPPGLCSIPPLTPLTDRLALQMEDGQKVIWDNTDPKLQTCTNKFIGKVGGTVTSAYRPREYQTHLWEIRDRWCMKGLQSNLDSGCNTRKSDVSEEITKHFGSAWSCGAVAASSRHSLGTGVDISGVPNPGSSAVLQAASESCLAWPNYTDDPVHYNLIPGCSSC